MNQANNGQENHTSSQVVTTQFIVNQTNQDNDLSKIENQISDWWSTSTRWNYTKRNYTPKEVASLRSSIELITPSHYQSKKLYSLLRQNFTKKTVSKTYGALDVIQAINMSKYLTSIYVSGWQCSSTHVPSSHEPGPDFADYPMNTVPDKVNQLVKAQMFHDRRQNQDRSTMTDQQRMETPKVDYLVPIIADADAGFGGITSVMKLVKMFIEQGVAGVHLEDQKPGVKKCGHLGGKVIVSTREMIQRLQAARLQADIMGCDLVIVARTDALSANLLDTNIDPVDHPFILGCVDPLNSEKLLTFPQAGRLAIAQQFKDSTKEKIMNVWNANALNMSLTEAKNMAKELGFEFYFDWDTPRTEEGYYKVEGSVQYCSKRALLFSDQADMIWMETPTPNLQVAQSFAQEVHSIRPHVMLAYNLSPSFNWDAQNMTEEDLENFIPTLASMGFCWQFITLAGFHMEALMSEVFSKNFSKTGMLAFVEVIQRKEKSENVDQLLHQKWSGVNLKDKEIDIVSSNKCSTKAYDKNGGCTETQFELNTKKNNLFTVNRDHIINV